MWRDNSLAVDVYERVALQAALTTLLQQHTATDHRAVIDF